MEINDAAAGAGRADSAGDPASQTPSASGSRAAGSRASDSSDRAARPEGSRILYSSTAAPASSSRPLALAGGLIAVLGGLVAVLAALIPLFSSPDHDAFSLGLGLGVGFVVGIVLVGIVIAVAKSTTGNRKGAASAGSEGAAQDRGTGAAR